MDHSSVKNFQIQQDIFEYLLKYIKKFLEVKETDSFYTYEKKLTHFSKTKKDNQKEKNGKTRKNIVKLNKLEKEKLNKTLTDVFKTCDTQGLGQLLQVLKTNKNRKQKFHFARIVEQL